MKIDNYIVFPVQFIIKLCFNGQDDFSIRSVGMPNKATTN